MRGFVDPALLGGGTTPMPTAMYGAQPAPEKPSMAPQRRGLFAALGDAFNEQNRGRTLQLIGAGLRQISHPEANTLTDLIAQLDHERDQQMQRTWQQTMQEHQLGAWKQEDQDRQTARATSAARAAALERIPE